MHIRIQTTPVFSKNEEYYLNDKFRYVINSGGSRSSKTYSLLQLFAIILLQKKNYKISCYRNLRVDCIDTCGQDFKDIMYSTGLYTKFVHNVKDAKWTCKATGSTIYFSGTEKIHKSLGQKNDIIFLNEISEFSQDVFNQLDQRTRDKVFIDYNPSKEFYIESYRENPLAVFIHSTYKDNPFLTDGIIQKLESYNPYKKHTTYVKDGVVMYNNHPVSEKNQPPPNIENIKNGTADRYMYEVYCLGIGSEKPNRIYKGWTQCTDEFFEQIDAESFFGLDFGVSSPTALVEVKYDGDKTFYLNEKLYKPMSLMGMPLHEYLLQPRGVKNKPLLTVNDRVICDSAKKTMVTDLAKAGLTAIPALKGSGSVSRTIGNIQSFKIVYTQSSLNLKSEYMNYSWKIDRYGLAEEIPAQNQNDHALDATGYIISYLINYLGIGYL